MSLEYRREQLYIGGEWVTPLDGGPVESIDPSNGRPWALVPFAGPRDVDRAVNAARAALQGPWARMSYAERAALLRRFADVYASHAARMAVLESHDTGRPIRDTRGDLGAHASWYHWFASLADKLGGRTIPLGREMHAYTSRVPVGVVAAITPWNAPMLTTAWKLGPALAAGCTVVLKPAEQTPVTAFELAAVSAEAGLPAGVLNVVPGTGAVVGAYLSTHPGVDKIAFTGSGATARTIVANSGPNMKRYSFELGGKAPHILFEDADLEPAINAATSSAWTMCGQSCTLGSRVLVQRSIYPRVAEAFASRAARVRVGLPLEETTHMGPQAHLQQLLKTLDYIELGRQEGAHLLSGGRRIESGSLAQGYFVEPTVFTEVHNSMRLAREEIFGPVAALIAFDDEEEAVAIANDSRYGLTAGLWTRDLSRAHRVSSRIEAGVVWVNTFRYIRPPIPYGGFKDSGWGRENGIEALDQYLETRATVIDLGGRYADPYSD